MERLSRPGDSPHIRASLAGRCERNDRLTRDVGFPRSVGNPPRNGCQEKKYARKTCIIGLDLLLNQLSGDEGDLDFKLSQGSSDDHSNDISKNIRGRCSGVQRSLPIIALAGPDYMRLPATWEKKLKGRDDKIIQTTQKELHLAVRILDLHGLPSLPFIQLQSKETEIANIINDMETIHQDFLEQYAILEDRKRKITAAIAEAQEELIVCPSAPITHGYIL
ncbi:hypothetical protein EDB19DRAFT_1830020 [Suillus lakei]|nr:hypothetical protein EDB19DRAFT_1830020 [Suillus lakei]